MPWEWVLLAFVAVAIGIFVAALADKLPRVLGGVAGFIVGLGTLFPSGCVTRSDPVSETTCSSAVGLPVPEDLGVLGGILLATVLALLFVGLPDRSDPE